LFKNWHSHLKHNTVHTDETKNTLTPLMYTLSETVNMDKLYKSVQMLYTSKIYTHTGITRK